MRDLEKQKEEVRAALEQREQDAVDQVKVIVDALEERAKVLQDDKQIREQLHSISDSVLFLQVMSNSATTQPLTPSIPLSPRLLPSHPVPHSFHHTQPLIPSIPSSPSLLPSTYPNPHPLSIHPCIHHSSSIHPSKLHSICLLNFHLSHPAYFKDGTQRSPCTNYVLIVLQA